MMDSAGTTFAFFDVDETLVAEKTMFTVLDALGQALPHQLDAEAVISWLRGMREAGASRAEVNRAYYRALAGLRRDEVRAIAARYLQGRLHRDAGPLFLETPLALLRQLQAGGIEPVFVSGSACDFLEPVAEHLGVRHMLATRLKTENSAYTGDILGRCMIGPGKADAVLDFLAQKRVRAEDCYGIGDHPSDSAFLSLLGYPYLVAGDPEAETIAQQRGWSLLERVPHAEGSR